MSAEYIHGYRSEESERLQNQAGILVDLLHGDTFYPAGSQVLEVGCGVGSQTLTLARRSPNARFTCIDINPASIATARQRIADAGLNNVELMQGDARELPFAPGSFDHIFICFVLEHLARPVEVLLALQRLLKVSGTATVIEGDHGSTYFHPESAAASAVIACQVSLQRRAGGNAMIGRQLYPLMTGAGLSRVQVSPRMVYVDSSRPEFVDGFTRKTFTAMIEGVRETAVAAGLISAGDFAAGVRDLYRTAEEGGVFCYTFFKAVGVKVSTDSGDVTRVSR